MLPLGVFLLPVGDSEIRIPDDSCRLWLKIGEGNGPTRANPRIGCTGSLRYLDKLCRQWEAGPKNLARQNNRVRIRSTKRARWRRKRAGAPATGYSKVVAKSSRCGARPGSASIHLCRYLPPPNLRAHADALGPKKPACPILVGILPV